MHPFLAAELGVDFSLERALRFGLVPLVWKAVDPEQTLRAYASLYLREEVQAEALVRDLGGTGAGVPGGPQIRGELSGHPGRSVAGLAAAGLPPAGAAAINSFPGAPTRAGRWILWCTDPTASRPWK